MFFRGFEENIVRSEEAQVEVENDRRAGVKDERPADSGQQTHGAQHSGAGTGLGAAGPTVPEDAEQPRQPTQRQVSLFHHYPHAVETESSL